MPSETAGDEIATQNQKLPGGPAKGDVLTLLVQALHLVDDGEEIFGVRARHIILLICARHKHTPKIKLNQTTKPRSGTNAASFAPPTADEALHGEVL